MSQLGNTSPFIAAATALLRKRGLPGPAHEAHPLADALPLMDAHRLRDLGASIEANGLQNPIVLIGNAEDRAAGCGVILDGRNRYLACLERGIEPRFTYWEGPTDLDSLMAYVTTQNVDRRDLEPVQRAIVLRRLEAIVRVRKARNQPRIPGIADVPDVKRAVEVVMGGTEELQAAVWRGDVPADVAVAIATEMEPEQQREAVAALAEHAKSKVVALSAVDLAALRGAYRTLESEHAAAAVLLRRMVPVL